MNAVPPLAGELAVRVLARESAGGTPTVTIAAAERVLHRLDEHLVPWFGRDGFQSLVGRAVDRARVQHRVLADARIGTSEGRRLDGLAQSATDAGGNALSEALIALVAVLFALLMRLIGDDMVIRVTHQVWPDEFSADRTQPRDEDRVS